MTPGYSRMAGSAPVTGPASLTPRQWQVLRLLAEGRTQKEAAAALGIAKNTVKGHLSGIYATLGVPTAPSAAPLVAAFRALGWLSPVSMATTWSVTDGWQVAA